jgi:hypothetical protein
MLKLEHPCACTFSTACHARRFTRLQMCMRIYTHAGVYYGGQRTNERGVGKRLARGQRTNEREVGAVRHVNRHTKIWQANNSSGLSSNKPRNISHRQHARISGSTTYPAPGPQSGDDGSSYCGSAAGRRRTASPPAPGRRPSNGEFSWSRGWWGNHEFEFDKRLLL